MNPSVVLNVEPNVKPNVEPTVLTRGVLRRQRLQRARASWLLCERCDRRHQ